MRSLNLFFGQALRKEIGAGERLLWSGMPRQGLLLRSSDVFMVPFSLLWGGFAFFWEFSVVTAKAPFFFMLWGIPFVLVGAYMIVGRFFLDSFQRSRTYYGLTNKRVLILSGIRTREVKTLSLQNLNEISLHEQPDGNGSIIFGSPTTMQAMGFGNTWPGISKKIVPAYELIENVRKVYDLVKAAQGTNL